MELNDNNLEGNQLKNITKYKNLKTLKFAKNQVKEYKELECLVRIYSSWINAFLERVEIAKQYKSLG